MASQNRWAWLSYIATLSGLLIPGFHVLVPAVIWLYWRGRNEFVALHAKHSVKAQLAFSAILGVGFICFTLIFEFVATRAEDKTILNPMGLVFVGLTIIVAVNHLIVTVRKAMFAHRGLPPSGSLLTLGNLK